MWIPKKPRSSVQEADLRTVLKDFTIEDWQAGPVEPSVPESTWLTAPAKAFPIMPKIIGDRDATRNGSRVCGFMYMAQWSLLGRASQDITGHDLTETWASPEETKVEIVTGTLENDYLYPLCAGETFWPGQPSPRL